MRVIVQSKTVPVTAALRNFIDKQAQKLLKHERITGVRVYLEKVVKRSNDPRAASVKYKVELPGKDIVVRRRATDMYDAVVDATNVALRHVRKRKEKQIDVSRQQR